jgi:SAM-dependent methyltransferase
MDELSKEYVISFYNKTLQMHGDRPEAVRWTSMGQLLHYECLLEIDESIAGRKILDYGCGKGDFYQFLKDRNISVKYTGFDINEELISLAQQKFPDCTFRVFDMEQDILDEDFDYIFLCGVFNLKVQGIIETIHNTLIKLFSHCRIALAFNALSTHDPKKAFELHYLSPENMFGFAVKNLSPFVSLIHDRIPYDFTMFIRKKRESESCFETGKLNP